MDDKSITLGAYQAAILHRLEHYSPEDKLLTGILGLAGESGKCADSIMQTVFHGQPLDAERLKGSLSMGIYYLTAAAGALGTDLEHILSGSIPQSPPGTGHEPLRCAACGAEFIPAAVDHMPCTYDRSKTEKWTKCPECGRGVMLEVF